MAALDAVVELQDQLRPYLVALNQSLCNKSRSRRTVMTARVVSSISVPHTVSDLFVS